MSIKLTDRRAIGILLTLALLPAVGASKPTARSVKDIETDLTSVRKEIDRTSYLGDRYNPKYRESLSSKLTPLLQKRLTLFQELVTVRASLVSRTRFDAALTRTELAYFGNSEIAAEAGQTNNPSDTTLNNLCHELKAWWEANGDASTQEKIVDRLEAIAKAQPTNSDIADVLILMTQTNPASQQVNARVNDILCKTLRSDSAAHFAARPNQIGKPLVISGSPFTGPSFSTEKWKGKVILVDFWATWCPPCVAAVPEVIKLYESFHDKGLEIVGVSSDSARNDLAAFLKQHPQMTWPQLFVGNTNGDWHPLTKRYEINAIPTMYLIDRNGILRSMSGQDDTETQITQLLDEQVKSPLPNKK